MPRWMKFYISAITVVFLGLLVAYVIEADEIPEKKEIETYETFEKVEFLTPEEGGTSKHELPLYKIKNANIAFSAYQELLTDSNKIVKEINEEIIPAYNEIYAIAKEKNKELADTRDKRDLYRTVMEVEGIALLTVIVAGTIYFSVQ